MRFETQRGVRLRTAWLQLNVTVLDLLLAVTALLGSLSLLAIASGEPETTAMVALAGLAVVALGIAFVRLSEYCRTDGLSLPRDSDEIDVGIEAGVDLTRTSGKRG